MVISLINLGIVPRLQAFLKWKWDILTLGYTCLLHIDHVFQTLRQKVAVKQTFCAQIYQKKIIIEIPSIRNTDALSSKSSNATRFNYFKFLFNPV